MAHRVRLSEKVAFEQILRGGGGVSVGRLQRAFREEWALEAVLQGRSRANMAGAEP